MPTIVPVLHVVWLVGFSLWKAIHLFAPAVLGPSLFGRSSGSVIDLDKNLPLFERDYRERVVSIARIIEEKTLEEAVWPPDIPEPVDSRDDLSDIQDKAVYDLVIMATAVMFLHELRHAKFHRDHSNGIPRPIRREEERLSATCMLAIGSCPGTTSTLPNTATTPRTCAPSGPWPCC